MKVGPGELFQGLPGDAKQKVIHPLGVMQK